MVRLLLIDGHRAVADALATLLDAERDIEVVGRVASLAELNDGFDADFDVALTRFILPDGSGPDVTRTLKRRWPDRKVVVLSAVNDRVAVSRVRRAGADALVGRDETMAELIDVVRAVYRGRTQFQGNPAPAAAVRNPATSRHPIAATLTLREMDVLRELCRGRTSLQICAELGIGRNTLRTHVQKIIAKLSVHSRLEAVALAQREGFV